MAIRLRPEIKRFAEFMELQARKWGLHQDGDQTLLYARAKDGLKDVANDILMDGEGLIDSCANIGNIMMLLVVEVDDG